MPKTSERQLLLTTIEGALAVAIPLHSDADSEDEGEVDCNGLSD